MLLVQIMRLFILLVMTALFYSIQRIRYGLLYYLRVTQLILALLYNRYILITSLLKLTHKACNNCYIHIFYSQPQSTVVPQTNTSFKMVQPSMNTVMYHVYHDCYSTLHNIQTESDVLSQLTMRPRSKSVSYSIQKVYMHNYDIFINRLFTFYGFY